MKCTGCALCAPLHIIWHEQENKRGERERESGWEEEEGGYAWVSETLFSALKKIRVCVCVCVCVCVFPALGRRLDFQFNVEINKLLSRLHWCSVKADTLF